MSRVANVDRSNAFLNGFYRNCHKAVGIRKTKRKIDCMQNISKLELYRIFIEFIRVENQRERRQVNRRMLSVFFWCFLLPAILSVALLVLIKFGALRPSARVHLDWLVLIFPILYSVYFLSSEVLKEVPKAFRTGGLTLTLGQALKDGEWRERVIDGMKKSVTATPEEWKWILSSFRIDLKTMQYRTRYLTALAGAVFFLIMQGIDSLTGEPPKVSWERNSVFGWVESTNTDLSQFVGLALFLLLLYLSGMQTYHSLKRYLNCAELLVFKETYDSSNGE